MVLKKSFHLLALNVLLSALPLIAANANSNEIYIKHGSVTLNGTANLAEDKAFKDGVVLMVHGTLAHNGMDTIKNLATVLNERGFSTLTINLSLGIDNRHGMYDCNIPHSHKHLDALDEIAAWLSWLEAQGVDRLALFGHSRGGNQVARFAAERRHPKLKRLVLLAPSLGDNMLSKNYKQRHGQSLSEIMAKANALVKSGRGGKMLSGIGMLHCPNASVTAESFISYYSQDLRSNTVKIISELKIPTLVVAGGNDRVVSKLPNLIKPMANGKQIVFALIDDAEHFFLDLFAEDVADHMEKFFSPGS